MKILQCPSSSCKKSPSPEPVYERITTEEKSGLQWNDINCYFFARNNNYNPVDSQFYSFVFYAQFADPPRPLANNIHPWFTGFTAAFADRPNVGVQKVSYNGMQAHEIKGSDYIYYNNGADRYYMTVPKNSTWQTGENSTFDEMSITVGKGFPRVKEKWVTDSIVINPLKDFEFDQNRYFENFDSIAIMISVGNHQTNRRFYGTNEKIVISRFNLQPVKSFKAASFYVVPINYSSRIINGLKCGFANSITVEGVVTFDTLY